MGARSNARLAVVGAVLAAFAAAGCGSGQSAVDRWRVRADNACLDARTAIERLGPISRYAGMEDVARGTSGAARTAIGRLRALDPPSSVRAASDRTIAALDAQLPLLDELSSAAHRHDRRAVLRLSSQGRAMEHRVAAAARDAGLAQCGSHGLTPGG
jgi:hypothetical protein